jgi:hypothetical protein
MHEGAEREGNVTGVGEGVEGGTGTVETRWGGGVEGG